MTATDISDEKEAARPGLVTSYRGYVCTIVSTLFFFLRTAPVPYVTEIPVLQMTSVRLYLQALLVTPLIFYRKQTFIPTQKMDCVYMLLASFTLVGTSIGTYSMLYLMPIGEGLVIEFSTPAVVTILAYFALREPCDLLHVVTVLVTFVGAVLVAQPAFIFGNPEMSCENVTLAMCTNVGNVSSNSSDWLSGDSGNDFSKTYTVQGRLLGSTAAGLTVLGTSASFIFLRKLKHVDSSIIMFSSVISATIASILTTCFSKWTFALSLKAWLLQIAIGVFGFCGQMLIVEALCVENAGVVSIIRSMEIVMAFLFQILVMHVYPNIYSIVGAVCITSTVLVHGVRKIFSAEKSDSKEDYDTLSEGSRKSIDEKSVDQKIIPLEDWILERKPILSPDHGY